MPSQDPLQRASGAKHRADIAARGQLNADRQSGVAEPASPASTAG